MVTIFVSKLFVHLCSGSDQGNFMEGEIFVETFKTNITGKQDFPQTLNSETARCIKLGPDSNFSCPNQIPLSRIIILKNLKSKQTTLLTKTAEIS